VTYKLRVADIKDTAAIGELMRESAAYYCSLGDASPFVTDTEAAIETYLRDGFGPHPAFEGLVAERDGEILGCLFYHHGYHPDDMARILYVIDLYVREDSRRQGIGRALMTRAATICRQLGGTQLHWYVWNRNESAFGFYERLGARRTRELTYMRLDVWAPRWDA
jgi:ribosomal protein S18 acetylase RimI-like enzyme